MNTSIKNRDNSFFDLIDKLPSKRQLVYQLVKENEPCTSFEVSEKYGKPINEITGRITELKEKCLLVEVGSKLNKWTKKANTVYRVVKDEDERADMIKKRFVELRDKKDSLINDLNLGVSNYTRGLVMKIVSKIDNQINQLEC